MSIIDRFRLADKKALVTGAAQGLGRSFALALAEAGADVAVADIDVEKASVTAGKIMALGRKSLALQVDIRRCDQISGMVQSVVGAWGGLDIAVNNVGVSLPIKDALDVSEEDWDWVLDVNLKGTFFCAQAEAKAMMPQKYGKIINIASMCGRMVWPEPQAVYSASKAGIVHLTRCLAAEWIRHGIRVNSISPGVTRTPDLFPEVIPVFLDRAPIDRTAEVGDHQGAVVYLASEVSDFMVGHDVVIDGGYTIM